MSFFTLFSPYQFAAYCAFIGFICLALFWLFLKARDRMFVVKSEQCSIVSDRSYMYKVQLHPFGEFYMFSVGADSQEEADELARQRMTGMLKAGRTVMTTFHRA